MVTMRHWGWTVAHGVLALALAGMAQADSDTPEHRTPSVAYPGVPPVIPPVWSNATAARANSLQADAALLEDLQARDFAQREAAAARLINIGQPALPALRQAALNADNDAQWWIRAVIQQIEASQTQRISREASAGDLSALFSKGPTSEALITLRYLSPAAAGSLVEKHARLELGMDCIYSLRPSQALPKAVELLRAQTEPFYQALLLRLIRNVLERALLPLPDTPDPGDPRQGITFVAAAPQVAEAVCPFLKHADPQFRREALLIMAWGRIGVETNATQELRRDQSHVVTREARRLRALFAPGAAFAPDPDVAAWIEACADALWQDPDGLAQLGAYYALYELVVEYPGEMAYAATAAEGRVRDALLWLLSGDAGGRAHLLRFGQERFPICAPASLSKLLTLRDYDLQRRNPRESRDCFPAPTLALVWRNLVNDEACGYDRGRDKRAGSSQQLRDELTAFGPVNLGEDGIARMSRPEKAFRIAEFAPWYDACAGNALSPRIPIAAGAIRGLLVSDLAGARALVKRCGGLATEGPDPTVGFSFARDLILMHPCVDLLDDSEVNATLRGLWHQRRIASVPVSDSRRPKLGAPAVNLPAALWGFMMQNDCSYMNPVGRYLAEAISLRHTPLLIALLEYNPRTTIFLAELNAHESVPAITREVLSRRKSYYSSYDHDIFHGVAHFGILDAAPALETYTKQNGHWPENGVMTLAGYEMSRYYWTSTAESAAPSPLVAGILREVLGPCRTSTSESAAPSPLVAGILREILGHLRAGQMTSRSSPHSIQGFCARGLIKMGFTETDEKASSQ